jgi:maleylpyruvate isomerase
MVLHGFFRSTASWRVRIALALKGVEVQQVAHRLREGDQRSAGYLAINPQGLVPSLITDGGDVLTQSLAICEYLEEVYPEPPILPSDPLTRARVRAAAQLIACDIHPIQNLKILQRLKGLGHSEEAATQWAAQAIIEGFDALEALLPNGQGAFAFGSEPTLADICLVPQMSNARRFGVELRWPRFEAIEAACLRLDAFSATAPANQPDAA